MAQNDTLVMKTLIDFGAILKDEGEIVDFSVLETMAGRRRQVYHRDEFLKATLIRRLKSSANSYPTHLLKKLTVISHNF